MPTYEYECKSCSHSFEAFQAMADAPLSTCPSCGGKVRRLIGGGMGIIFKGSGFYVNDSKKSSSTQKSSTPKAGEASPGSEGSSKSGDSAPKTEASSSSDSSAASSASAPQAKKEAV